jgi:tetratricopeptide (TPR) repeat protein
VKPLKDVGSTERAQLLLALAWLLPALLVLGGFTGYAAGSILGLNPFQSFLVGLAVVLTGSAFFYVIIYRGIIGGTASLLGSIYGGTSTPVQRLPAYSRAQALAVRGAYTDALAILEADIYEDPGDPGPYLAGATICLEGIGDRKRAIEWYRRALAAERLTAETGAYVCICLAHIHEAEGDTGLASVEFRRLLECYPETRYCEQARRRLRDLKVAGSADSDQSSLPPS